MRAEIFCAYSPRLTNWFIVKSHECGNLAKDQMTIYQKSCHVKAVPSHPLQHRGQKNAD